LGDCGHPGLNLVFASRVQEDQFQPDFPAPCTPRLVRYGGGRFLADEPVHPSGEDKPGRYLLSPNV